MNLSPTYSLFYVSDSTDWNISLLKSLKTNVPVFNSSDKKKHNKGIFKLLKKTTTKKEEKLGKGLSSLTGALMHREQKESV